MSDKTWRMRALATIAGVGATAVVLAGCTTTPEVEPTQEVVDAAVTIAETNEFTSTNSDSATGNLDINGIVAYLTQSSFAYVSDGYEVVPDESFGTMELVSEDPLQVKYTLNEGLEWSDGDPIDTDDLVLGWAVTSGIFDDATLDPETGEATSGTQYFAYAGSTVGLNTSTITEVADDKLSLTVEYDTPFVDWNLNELIDQPIHVVAEKAGVEVDALVETILTSPRGDVAEPGPRQRDAQGRCRLLEHRIRHDGAAGRPVAVPLERRVRHPVVGAHAVDDPRRQRELQGRPQAVLQRAGHPLHR